MMTLQSAKGLEWPLVFLLGVENDQFPSHFASSSDQVAQERRLLYVGMTRARRQLCLLWSDDVSGWPKRQSRFVNGLPGGLIRRHEPA